MALYRKEMARFFSCTIYALNSAIVMALLLAASILSAVFGADILLQQLEAAGVAQVTGSIFPLCRFCLCVHELHNVGVPFLWKGKAGGLCVPPLWRPQ